MDDDSQKYIEERTAYIFKNHKEFSERSYQLLSGRKTILEIFLQATKSLKWLLMTTIAALVQYILDTYEVFFSKKTVTYRGTDPELILFLLANLLIFMDCVISILRWMVRNRRQRTKIQNLLYLWFDTFTAAMIVVDIYTHVYTIPRYIFLFVTFLSNYRMWKYHSRIDTTAMEHSLFIILLNYCLLFVFLVHTFTCVFFMLHLQNNRSYFTDPNLEVLLFTMGKPLSTFNEYLVTAHFVYGCITNLACVSPGNQNDVEMMLCTILMLFGTGVHTVAMCNLTTLLVYQKYDTIRFSLRMVQVAKYLATVKISQKTRDSILKFYTFLWEKHGNADIQHFMRILPESLQADISLDMYWFAINQANLFHDEPLPIKRIVSKALKIYHYNTGEYIREEMSVDRQRMLFIARGCIHILSQEDAESPLLTLGIGSSIGDVVLIYNYTGRFSVVAASYCIVYSLHRVDFWRTMDKSGYKIGSRLRNKLNERIHLAQAMIHAEDYNAPQSNISSLSKIREHLRDETDLALYDERLPISVKTRFESLFESYILTKVKPARDKIFFKSTIPFKLQENSDLIIGWLFFLSITGLPLILVAIYFTTFDMDVEIVILLTHFYLTILMVMDIVVQLSTIIETPQGPVSKFFEIFEYRCLQDFLIFDLIAATPQPIILLICGDSINGDRVSLFITVLKLRRVVAAMSRLGKFYISERRFWTELVIKTLYLVLIGYLSICIYDEIFCSAASYDCTRYTYVDYILHMVKKEERDATYKMGRAAILMHYMISILTATEVIYIGTEFEIWVIIAFSSVGLFLYHFFSGDHCSSLLLAANLRERYRIKIKTIYLYMDVHGISKELQRTAVAHLQSQYRYNKGLLDKNLLYRLPDNLYREQKYEMYINTLQDIPLFQNLDPHLVKDIIERARIIIVGPDDVIAYNNIMVENMFIIDAGHVEIINHRTKQVKRILGAKDHFCALEMLLEKPSLYEYRAVTHALLLTLNRRDIFYGLRFNAALSEQLQKLIEETDATIEEESIIFGTDVKRFTADDTEPRPRYSLWSSVPGSGRRVVDEKKKHPRLTFAWFLRMISMKNTIHPSSRFLLKWEMAHAVVIWLSCMLHPASFIFETYVPGISYYIYALDAFTFVDMYVQMHVRYYDQKGLLISHSHKTLIRYLKGPFTVDIFSQLRLFIMCFSLVSFKTSHKGSAYDRLLVELADVGRYLVWLRARGLLYTKWFNKTPTTSLIAFIVFTLLIVYNFITCVVILITCEFEGTYRFLAEKSPVPSVRSFIHEAGFYTPFNKSEPINLYLLYYRDVAFMFVNLGLERTEHNILFLEKCISIVILITGFIVFWGLTCKVAVNIAIERQTLTFNNTLSEAKKFLLAMGASNKLYKDVVGYYNFIWSASYGIDCSIRQSVHLPIQQDFAVRMFQKTLSNTQIFGRRCPLHVVRQIGPSFEVVFFKQDMEILKLNDLIDTMYIIHQGEIAIYTSDGHPLVVLGNGALFGNLDEIGICRSMVTAMANQNTSLLQMKTDVFYAQIKHFPTYLSNMRHYLIKFNLSYVPEARASTFEYLEQDENVTCQTRMVDFLEWLRSDMVKNLIRLTLALVTFFLVTYYLSFPPPYSNYIYAIYAVDGLVLLRISLDVCRKHRTQSYRSMSAATKENIKSDKNILDLVSVLPIQMLALFLPSEAVPIMFRYLHANRLLRMYHIFRFFNSMNVNTFKMVSAAHATFLSVFCYSVMIIHAGACMIYYLDCITGTCISYSWKNRTEKESSCGTLYVCSLFYVTTMLSHNGHRVTRPKIYRDSIVAIIFVTIAKCELALIVGHILSFYVGSKRGLMNFQKLVYRLVNSARANNLSPVLVKGIENYTQKIWVASMGNQLPRFIESAPNIMLCDIMMNLFGRHILLNPLFEECHSDFLRLLIAKIKLTRYYTGDVICHVGDIDRKMYFIHEGTVEVSNVEGADQVIIDELSREDCFGIKQGLADNVEHLHKFKALSECLILSLKFTDWKDLLHFYPASKFSIYETVQYRTKFR